MAVNSAVADVEHSMLVLIDIQHKLAAAMPQASRQRVIERSEMLLAAAAALDVPVLVTEQYPKGLGPTEAALQDALPATTTVIEKTRFSAAGVDDFAAALSASGRRQVLIGGMETHICVLQTALDLQQQGFEVQVIEDAVCSRADRNHLNALQRLRQAGIVISNSESVLFEWLGDASHPHFKSLSRLIL